MIYLELFWSFFQVGLFSIGGGYAAMPLIQNQVVDIHPWLTMTGFADIRRKRRDVRWYSGCGAAWGTDCHDWLYFPVLRHRHGAGLHVLPFPRP